MISFSAPHQAAGKHQSVLKVHDQHISELQLIWMQQCPEGWREPSTDLAGAPTGQIIRNHAGCTVLDISTFTNSQARLILRSREAAAHKIYNLSTAHTDIFLWTAHHMYIHAGYPLPKNLQSIASQEDWIQENGTLHQDMSLLIVASVNPNSHFSMPHMHRLMYLGISFLIWSMITIPKRFLSGTTPKTVVK